MRTLKLCVLGLTLAFLVESLPAVIYEYEEPARSGVNYTKAAFRCWIPDNDNPIAGALVIIPEQNADGRDAVKDAAYRAKCEQWNFALIGCYFEGDQKHYYTESRRGSGRALKNALRSFSDVSKKRNLFNAPLALIGFSAGAQFSFSVACDDPEDVIAFVSNKGVYFSTRPTGGTYDTPGLFIVGADDETESIKNTQSLIKRGKERRALWAATTVTGQAHQFGGSETTDLILSYIEGVKTLRLKDKNPGNKPDKVKTRDGLYLHQRNGETVPSPDRTAEDHPAWGWLPNQSVADALAKDETFTPNAESAKEKDVL